MSSIRCGINDHQRKCVFQSNQMLKFRFVLATLILSLYSHSPY